jgi:hypothetical protein
VSSPSTSHRATCLDLILVAALLALDTLQCVTGWRVVDRHTSSRARSALHSSMYAAALLSANCTCWLSCEMRTLKCCFRISSRLLAMSAVPWGVDHKPGVLAAEHAGHGRAAVLREYFHDNFGVCVCL